MLPAKFTISELRALYIAEKITPDAVMSEIQQRIARDKNNPIWITLLDPTLLSHYIDRLKKLDIKNYPLWGIPFAIKDNIDLVGVTTTAACPAYAHTPARSASVVQKLLATGAIPIGKTNMDQFATGLVGTRSPYGEVHNAFLPEYISGGSSSGSALAVARGHVAFALGTDTAGSGRVPASLNNLVGLKPTRGLLSASGVVPACRTLDCVSLFTHTLNDAELLLKITQGFDASDSYSRHITLNAGIPEKLTIGVPKKNHLEFFGSSESEALFYKTVEGIKNTGAHIIEIDFAPFIEAAQMLYKGPWVAERKQATQNLLSTNPDSLLPVLRKILETANTISSEDAFNDFYRMSELRRIIEPIINSVDAIITPTIACGWLREDIERDPIGLNSKLGYYTNFMNLLDLAALAVPQDFYCNGLPKGITLFSDKGSDLQLLNIATRLFTHCRGENSLAGESIMQDNIEYLDILVCGAHMSGLPLNKQLVERGAIFGEAVQTAACYQLYALPGGPPFRPGLIRVENGGASIDAEVWKLPASRWGDFIALIPAPLGIGSVELIDGRLVKGFLCEGFAIKNAKNITELRSWRNFLNTL